MRFFKPRSSFLDLPAVNLTAQAIQILHTAAEFKSCLLQQIAEAKSHIYLCSLYLQHDEAGQQIIDALYAAKQANPALEIVVFVDWHRAQRGLIGEQKIPGKVAGNAAWYQAQSALHDAAIPIFGVPIQTRELFGVLHLKGYVIDDCVIYSGASINNVYLQQFDKYRHDRYWVIQQASLAQSMLAWMRRYFLETGAVRRLDQASLPATREIGSEIRQLREQLKSAVYELPSKLTVGTAQQLTVTNLVGLGKNNFLNRQICNLLAAAKSEICICTPYFNFPIAITREVNRALKRGVKVRIIVGDKTASDFYIPPEQAYKAIGCLPYLYEMNLRRFAKKHQADVDANRLQILLWKDGENTYHLKGLWIDALYTLVTGNNLNPRAFRLDLENALLFTDPQAELLPQREAEITSIMRHTSPVQHYRDLEKLADYPPKVRQLLARLSRVRLDRLAYRVL
ncbi:CDP-diacylglycerol--serine O-phosphatidyltransferase [Undibacterium baiyunense]|uniref:CDP-diacylglycerol--serine O-phosphatidyltransferase n=1 Tax=Undibacterium baiyunense TaxID=2828731 RepID=A0A941I456_9BURK|nr:CDP-diacylglycerol--serine O-phosphatidyltransferase [Undibacterium baiyunense]MBR7747575.1 CDP-diacylglycerol--serine O-phosphatidyltransferase [Undibacterium baiyunense]